jgi:RNA polymerase sigma factor (sigma-70 family)
LPYEYSVPRDPINRMQTRASLLNRLKDWQDQASWQDFFDTYWKLIYSAARSAGLADAEAQDVVQETMLCVSKRMPRFQYDPSIGKFRSWLRIQTRWCIINQFRKRGPQADRKSDSDSLDDPHCPAERFPDAVSDLNDIDWDAEWKKHLLESAIARVKRRLDPLHYQVYDFYVNQEWPAEKVAARFAVKIEQVYVIKNRVTKLITDEGQRLEQQML